MNHRAETRLRRKAERTFVSSPTIRVQVRKMVKRPEKVLIGLADDSPDSVWIIFDPRLRAPKKRDASRDASPDLPREQRVF